MSEIGHTPGPWEIEPKEHRDDPLYVMDQEGDRIARCDGLNLADFGPRPEQAKANARLIAAAPDLLSCLLAYVEIEEEAAPCSSSPLRERARAAIAKAVGQ